ncbi:hypothetical protein EHQ53_13960 [Leptospira langatensis]|uniref:DUF2634 domain-containing protein n=1 Tax=Leptospira langatensis TaxID=2484983 RepID=A0ABY2MAZ5_9LEPT|nr:hypothetical protein [Leptospira langatensis]TGL39622.1 hypothetical protein EHQ53_13960 [Leptospira langatensis]
MQYTIEDLFDFSVTANYGQDPSNVNKEIQAEVLLSELLEKKSLPYYRKWGTDAVRSEAGPLTIARFLKLQVQALETIQIYNDDADSTTERRVAVPPDQMDIDISDQLNGSAFIFLQYIQLRDLNTFEVTAN